MFEEAYSIQILTDTGRPGSPKGPQRQGLLSGLSSNSLVGYYLSLRYAKTRRTCARLLPVVRPIAVGTNFGAQSSLTNVFAIAHIGLNKPSKNRLIRAM